jgi:PKD repeat protein
MRAKSNIAAVTVIPVLTVTISPTSASITIGHSVPFTSTVSGGVAPYYYQWYLNGTAVLGAKNSTWTFFPTSMGTYNIYLTVTDSSGTTTKSNVAQVTVTISVLYYLVLPFFMIATLSGSFLVILLAMFPLKKKRRRIN